MAKGLSGGTIVVRPPMSSPLVASENTIIGNTVLYQRDGRYLFAAGPGRTLCGAQLGRQGGGRGLRLEQLRPHDRQRLVILGRIGANFGAGMTGGMAYLYDPDGIAEDYMNLESIIDLRHRPPALGERSCTP